MPRNLCAIRALQRLPFAVWVLALGVVLFWPALCSPPVLDDYLQSSMAHETYPVPRHAWDLYNFIDLKDSDVLRARGFLPWWADATLRIRFLRPLPSLVLWGEYRLGLSAPWMHLHSLGWWAVGAWAANRLYRAHVSARAATLATLIFALAPFQVVPLAWLANREALLSLALSALALHTHWKTNAAEARPGAAALRSTAMFTLAFASGEYALGVCGYVLAEAWLMVAPWRHRVGRALPALLPACAYLGVRARLGYGAGGSGFYTDPFQEPWLFAIRAPERLARLFLNALGGLDGELLRGNLAAPWVFGLFALAVAALWKPVRAHCKTRISRVFLLGSLLAVVPTLAVVPSPRLLGLAMLGLAPVMAQLLEAAWWPAGATSHALRFAALCVGFAQLVHGPATSWLMARAWQHSGETFERDARALRDELGDAPGANVSAVRGIAGAFFVPFALSPGGAPPRAWRLLSQLGHVLLRRTGPLDLELVAPKDQSLVPIVAGNLFRPEGKSFSVGQSFDAPGMQVTVLEVCPAGIRRAGFHFDSVQDTRWMAESNRGFHIISLPDVGFGKPLEP